MFLKKLLLPALFIALLLVLGYFGYPVIKERYFTKTSPVEIPAVENISETTNPQLQATDEEEDLLNETDQTEEDVQAENTPETNPVNFLNITSKDCDQKCEKYKTNAEDLKYCQEKCGLSLPAKNQDGCNQMEGLDADYCYKDLAVSKKDFKICDKIRDAGIKKTCQNRITEDLFNGGGLAD